MKDKDTYALVFFLLLVTNVSFWISKEEYFEKGVDACLAKLGGSA